MEYWHGITPYLSIHTSYVNDPDPSNKLIGMYCIGMYCIGTYCIGMHCIIHFVICNVVMYCIVLYWD